MAKLSALRAIATFLRHGSNAVLVLYIAGLAVALGRLEAPITAWAWGLVGLACFPAIEYGAHRFILHAPPAPWPWLHRMQRRLHYDHHVDPGVLPLLFAPNWFTLPAAPLLGALDVGLVRDLRSALGLLFGQLVAFLAYEWVHYRAHVPLTPFTPWGRWLKKVHLWHHFRNEHYWFGVTSPFVDVLAGTWRGRDAVPDSATTRHLYGPPSAGGGV